MSLVQGECQHSKEALGSITDMGLLKKVRQYLPISDWARLRNMSDCCSSNLRHISCLLPPLLAVSHQGLDWHSQTQTSSYPPVVFQVFRCRVGNE